MRFVGKKVHFKGKKSKKYTIEGKKSKKYTAFALRLPIEMGDTWFRDFLRDTPRPFGRGWHRRFDSPLPWNIYKYSHLLM